MIFQYFHIDHILRLFLATVFCWCLTGSYTANNSMIVNNAVLPGAETFTLDTEKLVLAENDKLKVSVSGTNSASVVVSYLEV